MSNWWDEVDAALQEQSEDAPDPWAALADDPDDAMGPLDGLTDDQEAFLRQLADQPQLGRFDDDVDADDDADDVDADTV